MDTSAGYLNHAPDDGRNPTAFVPGLSRRARGFAAWAVLKTLGCSGERGIVRRHCAAAERLAELLKDVEGLKVVNGIHLNQIVIRLSDGHDGDDHLMDKLTDRVNQSQKVFLKTAQWKGRTVLRVSVIAADTGAGDVEELAGLIRDAWDNLGG
jgi:glutamate/tyrosine decarboxylase-like PLP-dependent enzyme